MSSTDALIDKVLSKRADDGLLDRYIQMVRDHTGIKITKRVREGQPPTAIFVKKEKSTHCFITYPPCENAFETRIYIAHELGHVVAKYAEIRDREEFSTNFAEKLLHNRSHYYHNYINKDITFFDTYTLSDEAITEKVNQILRKK